MALKILILGVGGFIGSSLAERILTSKDWEVYGMDMGDHKIKELLHLPRFHFTQGDITNNTEWLEQQVKQADVILPLVAVANPSVYVNDPLLVFELDFEANLRIVRLCVKYQKHVVFPSTSEVYGMSPDIPFDEEESNLVLGPIHKQRWIYSCSKQLMDRIIYAYGEKSGLNYTLFRPFNWIGPKLDNILGLKEGSARAFSQFLGNILQGKDLQLVDGGIQRRCFTDIDDGINGLMRIIEEHQGTANRRIFNLGNPVNDLSVRELAELLIETVKEYPDYQAQATRIKLIDTSAQDYFGVSYQDVKSRIPSINNAKKFLNWEPTISIKESIRKTLNYHLEKQKTSLK